MINKHDVIRLETLLAMSLSKRWVGFDDEISEGREESLEGVDSDVDRINGLPLPLNGLGDSDKRAAKDVLRRFDERSSDDEKTWIEGQLARVRLSTQERNRRFERHVHVSQIL